MISTDRKILITWANWFIGANLVRELVLLWFSNINIITRKQSNLWRIDDIKDKLRICSIDMNNEKELSEYIQDTKPEIIYHLAAAGAYIGRDGRWIKELFEFNVLWTINLINACTEVWFEYFINTWSNSEYWEKDFAMKEVDLLEPNNEYWITKASATLYANYIWKKLKLPIYTFRLFSVFWFYEDRSRLVPSIVLSYINNKSPSLSKPDSVRDFIFINDVVNCYLNIDKVIWDFWWIFNIWSWEQRSIDEIVNLLKKIIWINLEPVYWSESLKQLEPKIWKSDNSKMLYFFWTEITSIEEWLLETYRWYIKNINFYK